MSIYTRRGDDMTTQTIGGQRTTKHSPLIDFYGKVDSLNSILGLAASQTEHESVREKIVREQQHLFVVPLMVSEKTQTEAAFNPDRLSLLRSATTVLEQEIDQAAAMLPPFRHFILPGGTTSAALLDVARCSCREAERALSALSDSCLIATEMAMYINRLSDWLYMMARVLNKFSNKDEKIVG